MEKQNSSRNAGLRLPIGFRFHPTDEELVVHYLKRKVCSLPLPALVIPELDVFLTNPWDLPGDPREKRYFFDDRKREENVKHKYSNSTRVRDGSGYWKAVGQHWQIISPAGCNQEVGMKRSLAFYHGKRPHGLRTDWVMDEYCLVASGTTPCPNLQNVLQVGDWFVCRIHRKQRRAQNYSSRKEETRVLGILPRPSSSSCSSGITDVSCGELDHQEANSCESL